MTRQHPIRVRDIIVVHIRNLLFIESQQAITYLIHVSDMPQAIKRSRTRFAAVRHWPNLSLSAYERDLVTNEKVWFRSLDPK